MAVNFPSNPTNGQTITVGGITYAYDSTQGVWSDSPMGLAQAIDALTDVDTSTVAPTNGQILQWNSTDGEWQPADSSAGVTVYATMDDLPLTGVTEGSMALVDATDKLYISNDGGWYSISIVNQTPSISGVNATYELASDGTATTVTVTASDPEGVPITYGIQSDTSGNIATVTQGTGSNANVWTITPTTNAANGGSFTLVFTASDGTNIASASSTFALVFVVENSNYTTALVTSVGANNAVNNSFDDASTNNHTITANGEVTQGTFSPYRQAGYSTYFDGSGDYIRQTDASLAEGTDDFTVEFWVKRIGTQAQNDSPIAHGTTPGWQVCFNTSNNIIFMKDSSARELSTGTLTEGQWYHVVYQRDSGTVQGFLDGVSLGTVSATNDFTNTTIEVGVNRGGTAYFSGYLRDVRIIKGTAFYSSSGFTPPTEPLTAVSGTGYSTTLLTCHLPYIADGGANSLSQTVVGNIHTRAFSPYDSAYYVSANHGGSMYFDGTGDYLSAPNQTLGSGDFCVEFWINHDASGTKVALDWANSPQIYTSNTTLYLYANAADRISTTVVQNQWTHIAIVRDYGVIKLYKNGVAESTTYTDNTNYTTSTLTIGGRASNTTNTINGNMTDVRVVVGSPVYTADFTPPTAPLTAITNTSLLLNGTGAGIIDKSQSTNAGSVLLFSGAKSSTAQSKYLTSSIALNGTSDFMRIYSDDGLDFGTLDFTIEAWMYTTSTTGQYFFDTRGGTGQTGWRMFLVSDKLYFQYDSSTSNISGTLSSYTNTWVHVAYVREGNNFRWYVDGTQSSTGLVGASTSITSNNQTAAIGRIGWTGSGYWNGYLSDLRITKGLARYTSNFTPPTAALEG
jgi:hypothetical protein